MRKTGPTDVPGKGMPTGHAAHHAPAILLHLHLHDVTDCRTYCPVASTGRTLPQAQGCGRGRHVRHEPSSFHSPRYDVIQFFASSPHVAFFSNTATVTVAVLPVYSSAPQIVTMVRPTGKMRPTTSLARPG